MDAIVLQGLSKNIYEWKKSSKQDQFFSEAGRSIWISRPNVPIYKQQI